MLRPARLMALACFAALAAAAAPRAFAAPEWPQFRGPGSLGLGEDDPELPETWTQTENVAWKTEIPGLGWASPVVAGNRVFLTTVVPEGEVDAPRKGLYFGGELKTPPGVKHRWKVICVDFNSGRTLWEKTVHEAVPQATHHVKNTYASETPVTDGERVYAYFGNLGLFVFDMEGKEVWSKKYSTVKTRFGWGTAASPVLYKDRIYIVNDNETESFLEALDKKTGKQIWRVDRHDEKSNWATPYIWENEKRTELVTPGTMAVRSYDLDGNLLWSLQGMSSIAIPTPFSKFGLLYVCSGYVGDKIRPIWAIRPGASGDITLAAGEKSNAYVAWYLNQAGPYNPSPLLLGDYLYVLLDRGFMACYDAKTGETIYDKQRIDADAKFTSSPWAYHNKIFCLSEDGITYVIPAGKEFKVEAKSDLSDMCMATPALVKGSVLLRTQSHLYRIKKGAKLAEAPAEKKSAAAEKGEAKAEEKKPEEKKAEKPAPKSEEGAPAKKLAP